MEKLTIEIHMDYCQQGELSAEEAELVQAAAKATSNAYAKYSGFRVGAALRLNDGRIVIGANQENAAYPSGLCAERTAIFGAQANYPEQPIKCLAIAAADNKGLRAKPVSPCGACRQVILEIEDRYQQPVEILLCGTDGVYRLKSVRDLLPLSFVEADMR